MDIWETDKLLLFIAFVVPGFISLKTYGLLFPDSRSETSQQLIDAIAYSSINYALLLWPIYEVEFSQLRSLHPTFYILFYVIVLFIAPIVWAFLFKWLRTSELFQNRFHHPTTKAWDYVFSQRNPYWIIVSLKNGQKIAGLYSGNSFASTAPAPEQLYLEKTWILNKYGGFERQRIDSAGIIIMASEIVTVEFFNITEGEESVR
jgi:hypothetical protein